MAGPLSDLIANNALQKLGSAKSLLDLLDSTGGAQEDLGNPPRRRYRGTVRPADLANLTFDPATGQFGVRRTDNSGSDITAGGEPDSWLQFPDPTAAYDLEVATDAAHTTPTGPFDLKLVLPAAVLTFSQLRGAKLDAQGLLVPDPDHVKVRFHLPRLRLRIKQTATASEPSTSLESVDTAPDVFLFCRMEPPHALIGPGTTLGFTFRSAILDLSETSNPPAQVRSIPADWQGIFIPEARIYVAPTGLEDLAVAAGVDKLWIGFGRHRGVTGTFEAVLVNRGEAPVIRVRFHDPAGRWTGTSGVGESLTASLPETSTVVVDAAGGIAPFQTTIEVGGGATQGTRASVSCPPQGVTIKVTVKDAGGHTSTVTVAGSRSATGPGQIPDGGIKPAALTADGANRIVKVNETGEEVELTLVDASGVITWSAPANPTTGPVTRVTVAAGGTVNVQATRTVASGSPQSVTGYFQFDRPTLADDGSTAPRHYRFSTDADNTHTAPARGESQDGWLGGTELRGSAEWEKLRALPAGTQVQIEGYASFDGDVSKKEYNDDLSGRRASGLGELIRSNLLGVTVASVGRGYDESRNHPEQPQRDFWKAVATFVQPTTVAQTFTGELRRPAADSPPKPVASTEPDPSRPVFPDWFHRLGARVRLERGDVVLCEIFGQIDIRTAAEQRLASNDPDATLPPALNVSDGISDFVVRLDLDKAASAWKVTASFSAVDADTDGLWHTERDATHVRGINTLGVLTALGPLLAEVAPPSPASGDVVPLVIAGGAAVGLAQADRLKSQRFVLHGGELIIGHTPSGSEYVVLLDLEAAVGFDAEIVKVELDRPVTTRYRALGLKLGDRSGQPFEARPVFDATRGYSLDIPDGAIVTGPGVLGDILQVFGGAKVSRTNPTYLEVEVGLAAEIGIVKVDRAQLRIRLDQAEVPSLSAMGATISVPGAFTGSGYVRIINGPNRKGVEGFFDLSILPPVGIRAAASLKIERTKRSPDGGASSTDVLGAFLGARLELPAPIPLGTSGLGIYGFAAGLGVNEQRTPGLPALEWLTRQPNRDPLHPLGWQTNEGSWAFAAGATLGTLDGGFILRMRGLLMLELPGPRVLILMQARILTPPTDGDSFPLLAAIDIGPDALNIGLLAEYSFASLVEIRVPVGIFFDFHDAEHWQFDLGTFDHPVTVKVLGLFRGTGYLMIHGKGIVPPPPAFPQISAGGLTLAVGFHVNFLWGNTDIGLYVRVAGGFDALVSIDPVFVAGKITVSGELRLFIVSIGASALLEAKTDGKRYHVHGEVCGKVDFFFFSVRGCVGFTLGNDLQVQPNAPPLVAGVALVSRSPALIEGSGTDIAIDGVMSRATAAGQAPGPDSVPVPLDAVPMIEFAITPQVAGDLQVLGGPPLSTPGTPANPWVKRGADWWRYELVAVTLSPPPSPGKTPVTWWSRAPTVGPHEGARLALLSWLPNATPRAIPYGTQLETLVHEAWGDTCAAVAPPAPFLFTFDGQPLGGRINGWSLAGIPWPDAPGTFRSSLDPASLVVTERWRCGIEAADRRRGIAPSSVLGAAVECAGTDPAGPSSAQITGKTGPLNGTVALDASAAVDQATSALASGFTLRELAVPLLAPRRFDGQPPFKCNARLLRSPQGDQLKQTSFGDTVDEAAVQAAWDETRFKPGRLADAVTLQVHGAEEITLLLALSEHAFARVLQFDAVDREGTVRLTRTVSEVGTTGLGAIPPRWWDPRNPWRDPVERALKLLARVAAESKLMACVARLRLPPGTDRIDIGLDLSHQENLSDLAPFYVAAAEVLFEAERKRADHDVRTQEQRVSTLSTVLAQESDEHAFLAPGQTYTVGVTWRAFRGSGDAQPAADAAGTQVGGDATQSFAFTAQSSDQAPTRLDPWVLDTDPGDAESSAFCDDPVRISFATQNVAKLFAAYGRELRLVLQASSGRHPTVDGPPTTGQSPRSIALLPTIVRTGGLRIVTPWEEAVRGLELPCVPAGSRDSHVSVELPFPLDAKTDYLIDIVSARIGGGDEKSVYRHGFTTSRYRSLAEFARAIRAVATEHAAVPNPAALASLPQQPSGATLDQAMALAGLDPQIVPVHPRIVVLWSSDAASPQPVAVVVEANEGLWRRRLAPVEVGTPANPRDPAWKRWVRQPFGWLEPTVGGDATVARIVEAPGSQRAVVVLAPGQRGRRLVIDLQRKNDPVTGIGAATGSLATLVLDKAPWEDDV